MRPIPLALAAAALLSLAATSALAAWSHDPVNGGTPISLDPGSAFSPVSVADGSGGAFVAFAEYRGGINRVFVQHMSANGQSLWVTGGVAVTTPVYAQSAPAIDLDGVGGVIVAWQDFRNANNDIFAQRISAAGSLLWGSGGLAVAVAAGPQTQPAICTDDASGAYIAWTDGRTDPNGDIAYDHVYANGTLQFPSSSPYGIVFGGGTELNPKVCRDGGGGMIIVWQSNGFGNFDIFAQRQNAAGASQWTLPGLQVCSAAGDQTTPTICPDGAQGALVAWQDKRTNPNGDIYAQRVWFPGLVLWIANGVLLSTGSLTHAVPVIVTDNAGGGIVVWGESRVGYNGPVAQRVSANGTALWTAGGVTMGGANADYSGRINAAADGLGGVVASFIDYRSGTSDTYAQRLNSSGALQWGATALGVGRSPAQDDDHTICADGHGGAILFYTDLRNYATGGDDLFANHADPWGILGAEPVMAGVKDVPNDNGGQVRVSWYASPLEADPVSPGVSTYYVFRSAPTATAAFAQRAGRVTASLASVISAPEGSRPLLARPDGTTTYFWELVATQSAFHLPTYSVVAPTTGDSMGVGNPRTAFLIEAVNGLGEYWTSAADSGYSVDNVPPVVPAPFAGTYSGGASTLHWGANTEADLAGYRLYRGTSAAFAIGAGSLVATPGDTMWTDVAGSPYWYKLTAIDIHGNESAVATLLPSGTLGVTPGVPPHALALAAPFPNPARGSTRLSYELPRAGHVRLAVYDAAGRQVRVIEDASREAGAYDATFDLLDGRGRALGAGLYLVRLETAAGAITRRLVTVR
jgi:hypothetical protein